MSYHELAMHRVRKFYPSLPLNILIPPAQMVELMIGSGMSMELAKKTIHRLLEERQEAMKYISGITPEPEDAA